jgi:hypothetical protein
MSVVEMFDGHVDAGEDAELLARMMPIGTLTDADNGEQSILTLIMSPDEFERIIEVAYSPDSGLLRADDVHAKDAFVSLLQDLGERAPG